MNSRLQRLLEHLAATLDPVRQAEIEDLHRKVLRWEPVDRLPLVLWCPLPEDAPFQPYPHSRIFDDPEKMLYNELVHAFNTSIACRDRIDDDLPCTVRANFGTVIVASMFGVRIEQVDENPPWARHYETLDEFKAAIDRDPLDFSRGWCPRVVETYQFYRRALGEYAELERMIKVVLPDLQGPLDTLELLRGSEIYTDFYTNAELMDEAMERLAAAQVGFAKHLAPHVSDGPEGFSHQHATMLAGEILVRNDSAVNVSPQMYRERIARHDEFVIREMGGGGIHCCGRIEHNIEPFLELPSIRALDLGQPEMNDLDAIYARCRRGKIPIVRARVAEEELTSGRVIERFPTGVSLVYTAESFQHARQIISQYREATEQEA